MTEAETLLARIGTARDAISRKTEQTSLDYMIDGVLMNCYVMLKKQQAYIEYWSAKYDEYGKAYMKVRDERDALLKEQENARKRNPVIVCPHCGKRVK